MGNVFTMYLLARSVFQLPFRGSLMLFMLLSAIFVFSTALIGIFVSIFTRTMIAAQIITMIVTVVPAFLYSGYLMPISALEPAGQFEARLLPAMHYMNISRGLFLKSLGIFELRKQMLSLMLFNLVMFALCVFLFKKREG